MGSRVCFIAIRCRTGRVCKRMRQWIDSPNNMGLWLLLPLADLGATFASACGAGVGWAEGAVPLQGLSRTFGTPRYCSLQMPPGTRSWREPRGGNHAGGSASVSQKHSSPSLERRGHVSILFWLSSYAAACRVERDMPVQMLPLHFVDWLLSSTPTLGRFGMFVS